MQLSGQSRNIIEHALNDHLFPGCAIALSSKNGSTYTFFGTQTYDEGSAKITESSMYDIASITKLISPITVALALIERGVFKLDTPLGASVPEFTGGDKATVRVEHLLTYTLDLEISTSMKSMIGSSSAKHLMQTLLDAPLRNPPGSSYLYSNTTIAILTHFIERATGRDLASLTQELVFDPTSMSTATLRPETLNQKDVVPTEFDGETLVHGIVHDESTRALYKEGTYAGAAGAFASIKDIAAYTQMFLNSGKGKAGEVLSPDTVDMFFTDYYPEKDFYASVGLGYGASLLKQMNLNRELFGTAGFTGGFVVVDRVGDVGISFLSNRIYPHRPEEIEPWLTFRTGLIRSILAPQ